MSTVIGILSWFILFGAIGWLIGARKGRPFAGLVWSMVLGPFGWLLMALLPARGAKKSTSCPHCGGTLPLMQAQCAHCANGVTWIRGRAFKPSRAA